ncbi:MAG: putative maltokinase [Candidatus Acidiferrales bacterium]
MSAPSPSTIWTRSEDQLQRVLPEFLKSRRWFGGKTRAIASVEIADVIPIPHPAIAVAIAVARVNYAEGPSEFYTVPLLEEPQIDRAPSDDARIRIRDADGAEHVFSDALLNPPILEMLFDAIQQSRHFPGRAAELVGVATRSLDTLRDAAQGNLQPSPMKVEQSNSSILYGRAFVLKFFRRLEMGVNPDFEVGRFLSERAGFRNIPAVAGGFEYRDGSAEPATMAILQGFVANQGDAWKHTLKAVSDYYDRIAAMKPEDIDAQSLGGYASGAALLGRRTAEMHAALASDRSDPSFAPEPFSPAHQRDISESMVALTHETFGMLRQRAPDLPAHSRAVANATLASENRLRERFRALASRKLTGPRIRIHGDLHLGQVLFTGEDFVFIDFEGEPARTLVERREKHSPLRDPAGMVRSFHYAAYAALFQRLGAAGLQSDAWRSLVPFANAWYRVAAAEYLRAYFDAASTANFLPADRTESDFWLHFWLLGKAVYELKYELNHRLDWVAIPLEGIAALIGGAAAS